jgi:hypothetical protein
MSLLQRYQTVVATSSTLLGFLFVLGKQVVNSFTDKNADGDSSLEAQFFESVDLGLVMS